MYTKLSLITMALVLVCAAVYADDPLDKDWTFATAGDFLGWTKSSCPHISDTGVEAGYLWAITTGVDPWIIGPDNMGVAAQPNHYIWVKMRMHLTSSPTDYFGASEAKVFFCTTTDTNLTDKYVTFKTYGNSEWKTYRIRIGNQSKWTGTIKRLRFEFCSQTGARVEIAWIRLARDFTPPDFVIKNLWNPRDNSYTADTTPTIVLRDICDNVPGLMRCHFYYRPGASQSNSDWVQVGLDTWAGDGFMYTYPELAPGVYDFAVQVVDNAVNPKNYTAGPDYWIDNVTIDPNLPTLVSVDVSNVRDDMPKELLGNNIIWNQWTNKYVAGTPNLKEPLETTCNNMLIGNIRYSGSDTFEWKDSIGPVASRPAQFEGGVAKFGLDEFLRWCEAHNIEPNLGTKFRWPGATGIQPIEGADPYAKCLQDTLDMVEYCNAPNDGSNPNGGTDWAAVRAANGHPEPYNVQWYEIGNEPWGWDTYGSPSRYGFSALDSANLYATSFLKYYDGMTAVDPSILVSSTAYQNESYEHDWNNPDWTIVNYHMHAARVDIIQAHPYKPYSGWQTDLDKLYYETIATPKYLDEYVSMQEMLTRYTAPDRTTPNKLRLNEWNINYNWWYDPAQGRINPMHTRTLKAALATADAFRVFIENRHSVESTGWWHLYGGGYWGCILTNDASVNPAYHVFKIFKHHCGDKLLGCDVQGSPTFDYTKPAGSVLPPEYGVPYVTAMSTKSADGKTLFLWVLNTHKTDALSVGVDVSNFLQPPYTQMDAQIWELNGPSVDDPDHPENVTIAQTTGTFAPSFTRSFAAHSLTSFKFTNAPVVIASVADLDELEDGTRVKLENKVVTASIQPDTLYIAETNRLDGINVRTTSPSAVEGNLATVTGALDTNECGERFIDAESVTHDSSSVNLIPFGMRQKELPQTDPDTTALLVTVWGRTSNSASGSFYVDDGSSVIGFLGYNGIKVYSPAAPGDNHFVIVRGVKSLEIPTGGSAPEPVIRNGRTSDVVLVL